MLHDITKAEFDETLEQKQRQDGRFLTEYVQVSGALFEFWLDELGPAKASIVGFILGRTLFYSKEAAQIWSYQFIDGIKKDGVGVVCKGVGLKQRAFREHLRELIEEDFLNVYRCADGRGNESEARLFAVNRDKLLGPLFANRSQNQMLAIPKKLRQTQSGQGEKADRQDLLGGVAENAPHNIYINRRRTKVLHSPTSGEDQPETELVLRGGNIRPLATPKRMRSTSPETSKSAQEVLQSIAMKHSTGRQARVTQAKTKTPWTLSKQEMQAVVDEKMSAYHPDECRMIVTAKSHGWLKRRMKESAPKDFTDFIDWVLRFWSDTARRHRAAALKDTERNRDIMSAAPDFGEIAKRYPYFLRCYSNYIAERRVVDKDDMQSKEIVRLRRQLADKTESENSLRRQMRKTREQGTARPAPVRREVPAVEPSPVEFDDDLPDWETFNQGRGVQNGTKHRR